MNKYITKNRIKTNKRLRMDENPHLYPKRFDPKWGMKYWMQKANSRRPEGTFTVDDDAHKPRRYIIIGETKAYQIILQCQSPIKYRQVINGLGDRSLIQLRHKKTGMFSGYTPNNHSGIEWGKNSIRKQINRAKRMNWDIKYKPLHAKNYWVGKE